MTSTSTKPLKTYTYTRPWLYAKQREAIFCPERISVIEASTKTGKTVGCVCWLFEEAIKAPPGSERVYRWVAPWYGTTKIAYNRMKRAIPRQLYTKHETELSLTLANTARIEFRTGEKPDTLYGEDVWALVLDEASRMREDAWIASRSTLTATRGPVRIIGNVKGRKNWAYKLARMAQTGEPGMRYAKLTAWDAVEAGVLAREEIEEAQRLLSEEVFRELYLAEPSDDGGNPFGLQHIRACLIAELSEKRPVAWGWDLAKKVDWTVGIGLDEDGQACRLARFRRPWKETIKIIRGLTLTTPALVDSTGVGDPIVEDLQRDGASENFEGFKFTGPSKQQLMEGLVLGIQHQEIGFPEGVISSELESFEFLLTRTGVRYSAPEGAHDDAVCALALAYKKWAEVRRHAPVKMW